MSRKPTIPLMLAGLGALALGIAAPASASAEEASTIVSTSSSSTSATVVGSSSSAPVSGASSQQPVAQPTQEATASSTSTMTTATVPEVRSQLAQQTSAPAAPTSARQRPSAHKKPAGASSGASHVKAPNPSALTPPLPSKLALSAGGVPDFFISTFSVPPFLLPIYQAAGSAYGVPWEVLAAINEVETDYGRDLNVSSAGAEGWMQFLPAEWHQYGVDANSDGFEDPYNPADAIFAAARYLAAAGAGHDVRAAVYAYNHSPTYVEAVMLRAELLGGTPPGLLSAITGLSEAHFPVHATAHFSDGFPVSTEPSTGRSLTLVGTVIYSQVGAPVIAVQDGEVTAVGESPTLGRYVSLRDSYGNTYTYAQLGSIASLYPVLVPRKQISPTRTGQSAGPAPNGPATAGVQPRTQLPAPAAPPAASARPDSESATSAPESGSSSASSSAAGVPEHFQAGPEEIYLHPLRPGVHVLAGTVLGHIEPGEGSESQSGPHILFQIRPAGAGASLIDPKPILDGWVELEDTSVYRAKGESPFVDTTPTPGQVLLESEGQLQQQVLRDKGIDIYACGRGDIESGQIDRRVLATLEFLSVSGLHPTVSALKCGHSEPAHPGTLSGYAEGDAVAITAINGLPVAGQTEPGAIVDQTMHKLLTLQGTMQPSQIAGPVRYPASRDVSLSADPDQIAVAFSPARTKDARLARALGSALTPGQWTHLIDRLGQIPSPVVESGHSSAAIPDPGSPGAQSQEANGNR
jgi:murein DD-endopeptidase MepM/ murein hydrolase activator NlpD